MHNVTYNKGAGNKYCGPAAMSALTGFGTGDCAEVIRLVGGRDSIKGSYEEEVRGALRKMGMTVTPVGFSANTIGKWRNHATGRYLVIIGGRTNGHWIATEGGMFWDSGAFKGQEGADLKTISRKSLRNAWKVTGRASLPKEILKSRKAKKVTSKRNTSARNRAKSLAKKLGTTVTSERGTYGDDWDYKAVAPVGKAWVTSNNPADDRKLLWVSKWVDRDDTDDCWEFLYEMMSEGLEDLEGDELLADIPSQTLSIEELAALGKSAETKVRVIARGLGCEVSSEIHAPAGKCWAADSSATLTGDWDSLLARMTAGLEEDDAYVSEAELKLIDRVKTQGSTIERTDKSISLTAPEGKCWKLGENVNQYNLVAFVSFKTANEFQGAVEQLLRCTEIFIDRIDWESQCRAAAKTAGVTIEANDKSIKATAPDGKLFHERDKETTYDLRVDRHGKPMTEEGIWRSWQWLKSSIERVTDDPAVVEAEARALAAEVGVTFHMKAAGRDARKVIMVAPAGKSWSDSWMQTENDFRVYHYCKAQGWRNVLERVKRFAPEPPKAEDESEVVVNTPKATEVKERPSLGEIGHAVIRESVLRVLEAAPNMTYKKAGLVGGVLRDLGVNTRGEPRRKFEARVNRVVGVMKRTGRVKEYKAKNVRVKLLGVA